MPSSACDISRLMGWHSASKPSTSSQPRRARELPRELHPQPPEHAPQPHHQGQGGRQQRPQRAERDHEPQEPGAVPVHVHVARQHLHVALDGGGERRVRGPRGAREELPPDVGQFLRRVEVQRADVADLGVGRGDVDEVEQEKRAELVREVDGVHGGEARSGGHVGAAGHNGRGDGDQDRRRDVVRPYPAAPGAGEDAVQVHVRRALRLVGARPRAGSRGGGTVALDHGVEGEPHCATVDPARELEEREVRGQAGEHDGDQEAERAGEEDDKEEDGPGDGPHFRRHGGEEGYAGEQHEDVGGEDAELECRFGDPGHPGQERDPPGARRDAARAEGILRVVKQQQAPGPSRQRPGNQLHPPGEPRGTVGRKIAGRLRFCGCFRIVAGAHGVEGDPVRAKCRDQNGRAGGEREERRHPGRELCRPVVSAGIHAERGGHADAAQPRHRGPRERPLRQRLEGDLQPHREGQRARAGPQRSQKRVQREGMRAADGCRGVGRRGGGGQVGRPLRRRGEDREPLALAEVEHREGH
ncbi:hypothetical protein DFJ74DRAFT_737304, partial [Hyaloraphidium curvatum]